MLRTLRVGVGRVARAAHHALQALLVDAVHHVEGAHYQRAVQEALQGGTGVGLSRTMLGRWRACEAIPAHARGTRRRQGRRPLADGRCAGAGPRCGSRGP